MSEIKSEKKFDISVEYQQTLSYLHHMYDTRHRIFQFGVLVNAGLLAVVFKGPESAAARVLIAIMGFVLMLSLALMAIRSDEYRKQVEIYAEELEIKLGFGLVSITNQRMPTGVDSSKYLFYSYWVMVTVWVLLIFNFIFETFGILILNLG